MSQNLVEFKHLACMIHHLILSQSNLSLKCVNLAGSYLTDILGVVNPIFYQYSFLSAETVNIPLCLGAGYGLFHISLVLPEGTMRQVYMGHGDLVLLRVILNVLICGK